MPRNTLLEIKVGPAYRGTDGEIRYPILLCKVGSGYTVVWDSVPPGPDYYTGNLLEERAKRPHGHLALKKFERWAEEEIPKDARSANPGSPGARQ